MHDLRRQALESGKTVSRKARSKQASAASSRASSRANSAANSRVPSRAASRQASDEEDGNLSDGTAWSTNSIDDVLASDDVDSPSDVWRTELGDRMEQIIDRKRSSNQGREESLRAYVHLLTAHYAKEDIENKIGELVPAILKSVKSETSEKETASALKALAITVITEPSEDIYEMALHQLKRTISDSESMLAKTAAIHALGTVTFYGGTSVEETQEIMDFFLEIVESDGHSIGAGDEVDVVTASIEEWGFLATQIEDMEDATEPAMEAFVEQLDSSDATVQIAAGENIALLYEKSYTELEEDEDPPSDVEDIDEEESISGPKMVKRYNVYRQEWQLKHTLEELAKVSSRTISKKDKKTLHSNFRDILNSVENPTRGPRYQKAVDKETGRHYGSRMTFRIHHGGEMKIDRWWKLHRLQGLRRILQGGFIVHYEHNEVILDSLPYGLPII
ncbi:IFRD domain-containing protein [Lineolata rhizophorae]|uniref:IFRD domain-containing protein n=1 Tax=Lineolata rhizophorae TaxID=578093 RepID=A0A6A6P017_9PEZI|nr:IFRD domain-containing protein [Lineolata rhizophorae]